MWNVIIYCCRCFDLKYNIINWYSLNIIFAYSLHGYIIMHYTLFSFFWPVFAHTRSTTYRYFSIVFFFLRNIEVKCSKGRHLGPCTLGAVKVNRSIFILFFYVQPFDTFRNVVLSGRKWFVFKQASRLYVSMLECDDKET